MLAKSSLDAVLFLVNFSEFVSCTTDQSALINSIYRLRMDVARLYGRVSWEQLPNNNFPLKWCQRYGNMLTPRVIAGIRIHQFHQIAMKAVNNGKVMANSLLEWLFQ